MAVTCCSLNYTSLYCALFAIATRQSRKVTILSALQQLSAFLFLFLSFWVIGYHVYTVIIGAQIKILNLTRIAINLIAIKNIYESYFRGCKFDRAYNELIVHLTPRQMKQIRNMDLLLSLSSLLLFALQTSLCTLYYTKYGIEPGFLQLLGRQTSPSKTVFTIGILNFICLFNSFYASIQYYNLIQFTCSVFTRGLGDRLAREEESKLLREEHLKKYIGNMNKLRRLINRTMSFHPFALLTIMWSFFVFGFAGIMTHEKMFTLYFAFITAGLCNLYVWTYALVMVHFSSKASRDMAKVRDMCKHFACQHIEEGNKNHKLTLTEYLMLEPLEPLWAWGCIQLQPSILLSFLNVAIPFTVMVVTTMKSHFY